MSHTLSRYIYSYTLLLFYFELYIRLYLKERIFETVLGTSETVVNEKCETLMFFRLWQAQHLSGVFLCEISPKSNLRKINRYWHFVFIWLSLTLLMTSMVTSERCCFIRTGVTPSADGRSFSINRFTQSLKAGRIYPPSSFSWMLSRTIVSLASKCHNQVLRRGHFLKTCKQAQEYCHVHSHPLLTIVISAFNHCVAIYTFLQKGRQTSLSRILIWDSLVALRYLW